MGVENNNNNEQGGVQNESKNCLHFKETTIKYLMTTVLFFCSFVYGIASFIYASSLVDLKLLMNSSIENLSLIFPIVCISFTVGSLFSGFLFRLINRHLCCVVSVLLTGASVVLTAHSPNISFMFSMAAIKGVSAGVFNTAQMVWIVDIWQKKSGPFLQALQFCVSIGSFITPLMNKPFLNDCHQNNNNNKYNHLNPNKTQPSINKFENYSNISIFGNLSETYENYCPKTTLIAIPYGIVCALAICGTTMLFIMFILIRLNKDTKANNLTESALEICKHKLKRENSFFNKDQPKSEQIFYIFCGFVIIGLCFGSELANFQLLATFTRYLNPVIAGPESALLMAIFGGSFTLVRGISVLIAIKIRPHFMLFFNFLFIIAGNLLLVFYGRDSYKMITLACALMGAGYSSTLPSLYTLLKEFIHLNNSIGAVFSFGGGLTAAINTLVIGKLIKVFPLLLIFVNLIFTLVLILFILIIFLSKYFFKVSTNDKINNNSKTVKIAVEVNQNDQGKA